MHVATSSDIACDTITASGTGAGDEAGTGESASSAIDRNEIRNSTRNPISLRDQSPSCVNYRRGREGERERAS